MERFAPVFSVFLEAAMVTMKKVRGLLLCLTMSTACYVVAEPEALELNLATDDIEAAHIEGSKVWIKLAEEPAIKLRTIIRKTLETL